MKETALLVKKALKEGIRQAEPFKPIRQRLPKHHEVMFQG